MTINEIKQAAAMEGQARYLHEQKRRLRERMTAMSQLMSGMPHGSKNEDKFAEYVSRLDAIEREYGSLIVEAEENRLRVERAIRERLDQREQTVIILRLLSGYSWRRLEREMHYDRSTLIRVFNKAIKKLEDE